MARPEGRDMKLTVFQSDKGDCLLLTSADGKRRPVDGGMAAPTGARRAGAGRAAHGRREARPGLRLAHRPGPHRRRPELLDDEVGWRVHDFQRAHGQPRHREPEAAPAGGQGDLAQRVPPSRSTRTRGAIEDLLAATRRAARVGDDRAHRERRRAHRELADQRRARRSGSRAASAPSSSTSRSTSRSTASWHVAPTDRPQPSTLGRCGSPSSARRRRTSTKLRDEWNEWLEENSAELVEDIRGARCAGRRRAARRERRRQPLTRTPLALRRRRSSGTASKVTPPNLASLMLLVEEGGKTLLLTGDGHGDDILDGLEAHGPARRRRRPARRRAEGPAPRLGAQRRPKFCRRVTADHYVFCGNGAHENPDLEVLGPLSTHG